MSAEVSGDQPEGNIRELVVTDLDAREQRGIATYGRPLTSRTDIDTLQYLYEELLDSCVYIRKLLYARDGA